FGSPPSAATTYTSVLPAYSPLNAIQFPSGEKCGFEVWPWKLVSRRALPPARSTTQMLLAYANAICVALTVGVRNSRVGPPLASTVGADRPTNPTSKTPANRKKKPQRRRAAPEVWFVMGLPSE